jgi:phosphoglycolate phosphatase-like HAD superfamily hydrolase
MPEPLLALARRWSLAPAEVLVVGDRADLDEACAAAAGMQFVGVSDGRSGSEKGYSDWTTASAEIEARTGAGVSK